MARRNLCYKHNCEEFDKLPDALRPVAAEWHTVAKEKCELCQEKKIADLRAVLEALTDAIDNFHFSGADDRSVEEWRKSGEAVKAAYEQARAALAAAGGEAGE